MATFCDIHDVNQQALGAYVFDLLDQDFTSFGEEDLNKLVRQIYDDVFTQTNSPEQALLYASIVPYWAGAILSSQSNNNLRKKLKADINHINEVKDSLDDDSNFEYLKGYLGLGKDITDKLKDEAIRKDLEDRLKTSTALDDKLKRIIKRKHLGIPSLWVTTGTDIDEDGNINENESFHFGALRAILNSLLETPDFSKGVVAVQIGNSGPLYLKLVQLKEFAKTEKVKNDSLISDDQMVLAVVDESGAYVYFDNEYNVTSKENGTVPYFETLNEKGIDAREDHVKNSIATLYFESNKSRLYEDLTAEEKVKADIIYEREKKVMMNAISYAKANPGDGYLFNIKGGYYGKIRDASIAKVPFDTDNPFEPQIDKTVVGTDIIATYFMFKGNQFYIESLNGLDENDVKTVTSLIFDDVYMGTSEKPMTIQQRRRELQKIINTGLDPNDTSNRLVNRHDLYVEREPNGNVIVKAFYNPQAEFNGVKGQFDTSRRAKLIDLDTQKEDDGTAINKREKIDLFFTRLGYYNINENGIESPDRFGWPSVVQGSDGVNRISYDTSMNYKTWMQNNPKFVIKNPILPYPYLLIEPSSVTVNDIIERDPSLSVYEKTLRENLAMYKAEETRRRKEYEKLAVVADKYEAIPMKIVSRPNLYGIVNDNGKYPTAFELVDMGYRTKTTRTLGEYEKYGEPKPGDLRWIENEKGERLLIKVTDVYITPGVVLKKENRKGLREVSRAEWIERNKKEGWLEGSVNDKLSFNIEFEVIKLSTFANKPLNEPTEKKTPSGFMGYKTGFDPKGKGTAEGDGKDKAMREVANASIVEFVTDKKPSSSFTTLQTVGKKNVYSYEKDRYVGQSYNGISNGKVDYTGVVMLARNGKLSGKPLSLDTKSEIKTAHSQGAQFVVGDMPGVDSQFIDYLQEIGAAFTIYTTAKTPAEARIQISQPVAAPQQPQPETSKRRTPATKPQRTVGKTVLKPKGGNLGLKKIRTLKGNEVKATAQQIQDAREWYNNSPLSKIFKFDDVFHPVNMEYSDSVGLWTIDAIILFEGADYSDLYHEAWHGFEQTFLTPEQRVELYKEVNGYQGTFKDYNGNTVSFKEASEDQIQEYLAESFREYVLSKGTKMNKPSPVKKNLFQKIWSFLKELFGFATVEDVVMDPKNTYSVGELMEKLRIGELSGLSFNAANASKFKMNKNIRSLNKTDNDNQSYSYTDSQTVVKTIDSIMSQLVLSENQANGNYRATVLAYKGNANKIAMYNHVYNVLSTETLPYLLDLKQQYEDEYRSTTDNELRQEIEVDIARTEKNIQLLRNVLDDFGDLESMEKNARLGSGVIYHHMLHSQLITEEQKREFEEDALENKTDREFIKSGPQDKSLVDLAKPEVISLIKSIFKMDANGNTIPNAFGAPELADFMKTWNHLAKNLENILDADKIYQRLIDMRRKGDKVAEQLLDRMGPLSAKTSSNAKADPLMFNLWTNFVQAFNKPRVPLVQMTFEKMEDGSYRASVGIASGAYKKVMTGWSRGFGVRTTSFIVEKSASELMGKDVRSTVYLDTRSVLSKYPIAPRGAEQSMSFLRDIGIPLSDTKEIREQFAGNQSLKNAVKYTYDRIQDLYGEGIAINFLGDMFRAYELKDGSLLYDQHQHLNTFANIEAKFGNTVSNFMSSTATGATQFEHSLNSSLSRYVYELNNSEGGFFGMIAKGHMNHYDPRRNPWTRGKRSLQLNSLFDMSREGVRRKDASGRTVLMKVDNISGIKSLDMFGEETGVKTSQADPVSKFLLDFHSFHLRGTPELMTMSDKTTTLTAYTSAVHNPHVVDGKNHQRHKYIDDADFLVDQSVLSLDNTSVDNRGNDLWYKVMSGYLYAEIERIRMSREMLQTRDKILSGEIDPNSVSNKGRYDYKYAENGTEFVLFDDILNSATKQRLIAQRNSFTQENIENQNKDFHEYLEEIDPELADAVRNEIVGYLDKQMDYAMGMYGKINYMDGEIIKRVRQNLDEKIAGDKELKREAKDVYNRQNFVEASMRSYVANAFIHNVENMILVYGDIAMYKVKEDDFHKRNAGFNSTGDILRTDKDAIDFVNSLGRPYAKTIEGAMINTINDDGSFNTAVMEDSKQNALFYDDYREIFYKYFLERNKGDKTKANEETDRTLKGYLNIDEGDGQGWISFDFYRNALILLGKWDWNNQETLYMDIVKGKDVDMEKIQKFFPVLKFQYMGPIKSSYMPTNAMHKFSLVPLIPNVIKNTTLEKLHNRMLRQGIEYALFKSASKVSTFTEPSGDLDKFYKNNEELEFDDYKRTGEGVIGGKFTPNTLFLHYLKDQLETGDEFKNKVTFATQLRKLIIEGLVANGVPIDYKPEITDPNERVALWEKEKNKDAYPKYKAFKEYEQLIYDLTEAKYAELLDRIGWKKDSKGKPTGNIEDLKKYVERNLEIQDIAAHELDFIALDPRSKKFKFDFSLSFSSEQIERLLNALVVKELIRQKIKGEALVQVSRAGWEKPTEGQLKKYKREDLPFYKPVFEIIDGKKVHVSTTAMKVKIALQGDFRKLLMLESVKNKAAEENITPLQALNLIIRDEKELDKNNLREMITMVAARIPTQGLNSMEYMEVYEFLPEDAGHIIIMPSEIVGKTGSDFDIDKMFTMMPSIYSVFGEVRYLKHTAGKKTTPAQRRDLAAKEKKLIAERNVIKEKYDDILDRKDKENEFKWTPEQLKTLKDLRKEYNESTKPLRKEVTELEMFEEAAFNGELSVDRAEEVDTKLYEIREQLFMMEDIFLQKQSDIVRSFNNEKLNKILDDRAKELKPVNTKIADVHAKIYASTSKGVSNSLITSMRNILQMPDTFVTMMRPNATDIFDDLAESMADFSSDYDPYATLNDEGTRRAVVKGKEKRVISGTRLLEIGYNIYKRNRTNVGKQVLGIGAVENTYNVLYNRIGMYLNAYANDMTTEEFLELKQEYDQLKEVLKKSDPKLKDLKKTLKGFGVQEIMMPHNQLEKNGNKVVSLSHIYTVDGKHKIADIISQMINGWVDVAKNDWIFNVQGNKEVSPTLLMLVEAGVPIEHAVYFVSQPLVQEYVQMQRNKKSIFAGPMGVEPSSYSRFRYEARMDMIKKYGILGSKSFNEFENENGETISYMEAPDLQEKTIEMNSKFKNQMMDEDNLWERLGQFKKDGKVTEFDKAVLLHFIQLEEMAKASQMFKLSTNVDTSRAKTLMEASAKELALANLKAEGRIPTEMVEKISNDTVLSSFFNALKYQQEIWSPLFSIRDNKYIKNYLLEKISGSDRIKILDQTFGNDMNGVTKFYKTFLNDLMTFLFQRKLYSFDLSSAEYYKGYQLETEDTKKKGSKLVSLLYSDHPVFFEKGKVYVDKNRLASDYLNLNTLSAKYKVAKVEKSMFPTEDQYFKFVFERELLRSRTPISSIKDNLYFNNRLRTNKYANADKTETEIMRMTYEEYIRDMALMNTFNIKAMFYKADVLGSNKTMADTLELIKAEYPSLKQAFPLLETLSIYKWNNVANIRLEDSPKDSDTISSYNEQMKALMNPDMLPSDISEQDRAFITGFFEKLPFFSILQSGYDTTTSLSIQRIMPWNKYMVFMNDVSKEIAKNMQNKTMAEAFASVFMPHFIKQNSGSNKNSNRVKHYNNESLGIEIFTDEDKFDEMIMTDSVPKSKALEIYRDYNGKYVYNIRDYSASESLSGISRQQYLKEMEDFIAANPDKLLIYNDAMESNPKTLDRVASINDWVLKTLEPKFPMNIKGLPTRMKYGNITSAKIQEVDNQPSDEFMDAFDQAMSEIMELVTEYQKTPVLNSAGYGQVLVGRDDATGLPATQKPLTSAMSKATFDFISRELLDKFEVVNPGFENKELIDTYQQKSVTLEDILEQIGLCSGKK